MSRRMPNKIAAWFAAGAMGLGVLTASPADRATASGANQIHVEAMKVELAWMADQRLFNLPLQAMATADGLEIRGRVGDEATRQHAIKLARQSCYLPIRDALEISRPCVNPMLRDSARDRLAAVMTHRAAHIEVNVEQAGVVLLSGSVASMEDKLDAGRSLRGLPGCLQLDNRLTITHGTVVAAPTAKTVVRTAEATRTGSGTSMVITPVVMTGQDTTSNPSVVPSTSSPRLRIESRDAAGMPLPAAPSPTLPSGNDPNQYVRIQVRYENQETPSNTISQAKASGLPTPANEPLPQDVTTPMRGSLPPARSVSNKPAGELSGLPGAVRVLSATEPVIPLPPAPPRSIAAHVTTPTAAPAQWPAAHAVEGGTVRVGTPTEGVRTGPITRPVAQSLMSRYPSLTPVKAMPTSTSLVTASKGSQATATATEMMPATPNDNVRSAILASCGKIVKSVRLETRSDGRNTYHIHASAKVEQELVSRLLTIPQVVGTNAHIQIHLQP